MADQKCIGCGNTFSPDKKGRSWCSRNCYLMHNAAPEWRYWQCTRATQGDECWPWTGYRNQNGYGYLLLRGKQMFATHLALMLDGKPRTGGAFALHSCDNPACVNPYHLRWGNPQDNADDRERRGRGVPPRGERHGMAKLTDEKVRYIRTSAKPPRVLARELGVSNTVVYLARQGRTWRHVV